jgi:prophage regulatory protein
MNDAVRKAAVRLLRTKEVLAITGLSRVTIYRLEQSGLFPRRLRLGKSAVAWVETDI